MKISELGEFKLIDLVAGMISDTRDEKAKSWQGLLVGIGDDTAAWRCTRSTQLATVDCLVQDIHFNLDIISWQELGWRSLAVNLSDIAAMGGIPQYILISLGLPGDTEVKDVSDLYRGLLDLAKETGIAIVGGNMTTAPLVFIDITVIGETSNTKGKMLTRSSAVPGDLIAVTGYLGSAAAGLEMLKNNLKFNDGAMHLFREAFIHPRPRLEEGRLLVEQGVKAALDISDGLVADLGHICEMSRVGARVEVAKVPVSLEVKANFGNRALGMALSGGEDYELLFTAESRIVEKVKKQASCPITVIGEIIANEDREVILLDSQGDRLNLKSTGWKHFQ